MLLIQNVFMYDIICMDAYKCENKQYFSFNIYFLLTPNFTLTHTSLMHTHTLPKPNTLVVFIITISPLYSIVTMTTDMFSYFLKGKQLCGCFSMFALLVFPLFIGMCYLWLPCRYAYTQYACIGMSHYMDVTNE